MEDLAFFREPQTRWQFAQVKSFVGVGGMGVDWSLCRLRVLFTSHWLSLFNSACLTPALTVDRQSVRSAVADSRFPGLMLQVFKSRLQTSL